MNDKKHLSRRQLLQFLAVNTSLLFPACARTLFRGDEYTLVDRTAGLEYNTDDRELLLARRSQRHNYRLPTLEDIRQYNLVHLIINIEHEWGKHNAFSFRPSEGTREGAITQFEELAGSFERTVDCQYIRESIAQGNIFKEAEDETRTRLARIRAGEQVEGTLEHMDWLIRNEGYRYFLGDGKYLTLSLLQRGFDCDMYSYLIIGLGERFGFPLQEVAVPNHSFVRWESPSVRINFDQGHFEQDDTYINGGYHERARRISPSSLRQHAYLQSLTKQETVAVHLASIAPDLTEIREYVAALDLVTLATQWAPRNPGAHINRAAILINLGYFDDAIDEYYTAHYLDPYFQLPAGIEDVRDALQDNGIETRMHDR